MRITHVIHTFPPFSRAGSENYAEALATRQALRHEVEVVHRVADGERPEYELGMLAAEMMRACRVVIDIGLHCGFPIPAGVGFHPGEPWTWELSVEMLRELARLPADFARSEATRYSGWPGQAISYKLGERQILQIRNEAKRTAGSSFDLAAFHDRIIGYGPMRFDLLRQIVADPGY